MKKSKLLCVTLITLIAVLLCGMFMFTASAEDDTPSADSTGTEPTSGFILTTADGDTTVAEGATWSQLLAYKPTAIKCYSDIEVDKAVEYTKTLDVDLNGHTIKQNGGRVRPDGSATITIHDGYIEHKSSANTNFAYCSSLKANLVIEDCTIDCTNSILVDWRGGNITLSRVNITSTADSSSAFIRLNSAANNSTVTLNDVTYKESNQVLVSVSRDADDISKSVVLNGVTIDTGKSIISVSDNAGGATAATVTVKGDSKLSFGDKFASGGTFDNIKYVFAPGVKATKVPTVEKGEIVYIEDSLPFGENTGDDKADYPYVTVKSPYDYVLTLVDGSEQKIEKGAKTFYAVMSTKNLESVVCYTDPSLPTTTAITLKSVTIDLNGHVLTHNGKSIGVASGAKAEIRNGTLVHTSGNLIRISEPSPSPESLETSPTLLLDNCEIKCTVNAFQILCGNVIIKNSKIKQTTTQTSGQLIWLHTNGTKAGLTLENSDVDIKTRFFTISKKDGDTEKHLTIKDSSIKTAVALLSFTDTTTLPPATDEAGNQILNTKVTVTGNTRLDFASFIANQAKNDIPHFTFGVGVRMSDLLNITQGVVEFKDGAEGFGPSYDETYKYEVMEEIPLLVKPQFALTLYTDFTLNLCISENQAERVTSVKVGGKEIIPVINDGLAIYGINGISPQSVATKQKIEITVDNYDTVITKTIAYSVMDYANALLATDYSVDSKELICRAIDYSKALCEYSGAEVDGSVSSLIEGDKYVAASDNVESVPESNIDTDALKPFIKAAKLMITNTGIAYRFYIQDSIGSGELKVSSKTFNQIFTVEETEADGVKSSLVDGNNYFDVNMRAYDFYDGAVVLTYGENIGSYDFRAYANSKEVAEAENESLTTLVLAIYNYFREANEYARVIDKDFVQSEKHVYDYANDSDGTLKILCIGNSYSVDTMHYAQRILADLGIDNVTLGNLYIGGCPIGTHYNNLINDKAEYRFYYNTTGKWSQTEGYTIKQALLLEDWDFVSFQQRSGYSGKPAYYENLQPLVDEVRKIEPNATFLWNMTWAYEEGYEGLSDYRNSQRAMYDAIVDTVESVIIPNGSFEFISPVGTAVQNARTSSLGDTLNRDGTHLSYSVGRYIAALTFAGAVTGRDISGVTWRPTEDEVYFNGYPVSEEEQKIAIESAQNALKTPLTVTESQYK